jgi:hypothetical protein
MTNTPCRQILKCHDDHLPVSFSDTEAATATLPRFRLDEGSTCSWATRSQPFGADKLRSRIEPWLTALVQSEHLSLLVGSGLTHAVHGIAGRGSLPGMSRANFGELNDMITAEAQRTAALAGREQGNIEDQIRAANELLRGLEILGGEKTEDAARLRSALNDALDSFAKSILRGEHNLVTADAALREKALNYLVSFLMGFASRAGTRERLQLFTTNYDRYIEAGADAAGLRLIDRFVGTLAPVFRASRLDVDLHYNPPGIRGEPRYLEGVSRFTKLHGSVDWVESERSIHRMGLPFGVDDLKPYFAAPGLAGASAMRLMIYPNAAKDRETASYPYVELFRDFAAATCRPNSTLICYGYSFGDEHINQVIEDMLTIPSAHLVVMAHGDSLGRIMASYEKLGRHAQFTLLIGNHLGDFRTLVDHYLPKPAIDRTTFRMAELLKARWGTSQPQAIPDMPTADLDGGPLR